MGLTAGEVRIPARDGGNIPGYRARPAMRSGTARPAPAILVVKDGWTRALAWLAAHGVATSA